MNNLLAFEKETNYLMQRHLAKELFPMFLDGKEKLFTKKDFADAQLIDLLNYCKDKEKKEEEVVDEEVGLTPVDVKELLS